MKLLLQAAQIYVPKSLKLITGENRSVPESLSFTITMGEPGPVSFVQVYVGLGKAAATHSRTFMVVPLAVVIN